MDLNTVEACNLTIAEIQNFQKVDVKYIRPELLRKYLNILFMHFTDKSYRRATPYW